VGTASKEFAQVLQHDAPSAAGPCAVWGEVRSRAQHLVEVAMAARIHDAMPH